MTKEVITIGKFTVDADLFAAYQKKAQEELKLEHKLKGDAKESALDFKETVEAAHMATKIPKGELSKYFKSRFEDSLPKDEGKVVGTKAAIDRGELYSVLNSVLDK